MQYKKNAQMALAMIRAGLNCSTTAKKAGISLVTLSLIFNNRRRPKKETAARIAAALGKPVEFFGWEVRR